ncbi:MAG: hypothetical protein US79_C0013G0006 [Parcubacteria group bacterium GW2011_GWC1_38_17]|nr:MAG: hypothetical protein US79_C0013G0006 [Parcubacteria group bacterium GW2011_GWC1_38_17]KKQ58430.1 MAG: hypothetical protein US78_C0017G0006 [Parcubacteria group bacterium GW2011_GWD1_38_16]
MKKIGSWLVMAVITLIITAVYASAQTPTEQIAEINYEATALAKVQDALMAEQADIDAEKQQLIEQKNTYDEAMRIFKEKDSQLVSDISAFQAEISQRDSATEHHNIDKPDPYDTAAVNSYNAEAERLNAWRDRIGSKKDDLERRIDDEEFVANGLENSRKKYNEYVIAWAAKSKSLNDRWDEQWAKVEKIKHRMLDACKELIENPNTKDEALKLGCGNVQFDNADPNLPPLR